MEKLLEDAQIKLGVVASDIFGASGRAMLAALIAGERDPTVLADMARTRLRAKTTALQEAFVGRFSDQHAFLLAIMLQHAPAHRSGQHRNRHGRGQDRGQDRDGDRPCRGGPFRAENRAGRPLTSDALGCW